MVCLRNISCMLKLLPGFPRLPAKLNWICLGSNSITRFKATILVTSEKLSTGLIWHKTPLLSKRALSATSIKVARFNIAGRISKYWLSLPHIFKGQASVPGLKICIWNSICSSTNEVGRSVTSLIGLTVGAILPRRKLKLRLRKLGRKVKVADLFMFPALARGRRDSLTIYVLATMQYWNVTMQMNRVP